MRTAFVKILFALSLLLPCMIASAQNRAGGRLYGTVSVIENGKLIPVDYAVVMLRNSGQYATSDKEGKYSIPGIDPGSFEVQVQMIGYETIDTTLTVRGEQRLDFVLQESNFRLKEVTVVAQASKAGDATASLISRQAIDHSQTSSLGDIMQLLPGVAFSNPNLSSTQTISLRSADATAMNSLGTAIIVDGSPLSNNANMEGITAAMTGSFTTVAGSAASYAGALPNSGVDVRQLSTDNIESVEVIRGIPSVQYGDLTSGAVIINSKAGVEPLTIRIKTDPKIFQASASRGFRLGRKSGDMHLSGDYAYSNAKTTEAYAFYQRFNFKTMWTKRFGSLNNSTSLDLKFGRDTRNNNPDDASSHTSSGGTNVGYRMSANGTWSVNRGWLKTIRYDLSNSFTYKESFKDQLAQSANSIYSTNMTSGTTVSNIAGRHLYDADGNEVTSFGASQTGDYAIFMPNSYDSHYDFYAKELNTYAKLTANLYKSWGNTSEKILLGADFKSDGNLGDGLVFPEGVPPYRSTNPESGYRSRPLYDIPFVNQTGLFGENTLKTQLLGRQLFLTLGVRYDRVNGLQALSPRANGSVELLPGILALRGGWGVTAKAPTSSYLYPNNVYYDQSNLNNQLASDPADRIVLATTYIYNTENPDLEIARNRKAELGLDLTLAGRYKLSVTYYDEMMNNGYQNRMDFNTIVWAPYRYYSVSGHDAEGNPVLTLVTDSHKFFAYYTPMNTGIAHNRGVEWELNLGRFDAIRTSFYLNGAWMHTMNTTDACTFDVNSKGGSTLNSHYAVYAPRMEESFSEKMLTTLRMTHNIPAIGLAVTLTGQLNMFTKSWSNYNNDEIPSQYISVDDGQVYPFTAEMAESPDYRYMLDQRSATRFILERHHAFMLFNLNVSKEIRDFMTASFYVNNLFNFRPLDPSEISTGSYTELGTPMYFGFEIKLKLK
ncbi:MAG: TonB-dependent receptor [Bacteroidales bacterium]|nr:TonB-dependent receptor [Bacteroidales bacterium]